MGNVSRPPDLRIRDALRAGEGSIIPDDEGGKSVGYRYHYEVDATGYGTSRGLSGGGRRRRGRPRYQRCIPSLTSYCSFYVLRRVPGEHREQLRSHDGQCDPRR
jgi:hypothetical protein